ncbi:MAG: deaminated glutathione amidase [Frankiales bacterium]|nr:deaminated glutathione amidase [Frankiales bacterium]
MQFASGADKAANLARVAELVGQAADRGAQLIVAPEASMHAFGQPGDEVAPAAEALDGAFVTGLSETARKYSVTVVAGMFETVEGDTTRAYNTVVAVGPDGELIGRYRKVHLFDALGHMESDQLAKAPIELLTFPCGEFTVGVMTCYDLRFPELARSLVEHGVTCLAVPSAWVAGPMKEEQWSVLVRARAIENTTYVVAADQAAPEYSGHSMVADPYGVSLAQLGEGEGVAVAQVSGERLSDVRRRMPSLEHRRL